jgi:polysaccharide biosynthesis transport protein
MLQRNYLQTDSSPAALGGAARSNAGGEAGIGELVSFGVAFVRRQYIVILITAALVVAASIVYLRITPPTYMAQVQILLGNPRAQFVQQQSIIAEPNVDLSQIETQLQILKSSAIAAAVITKLKLADDPAFQPSTVFSLLHRVRGSVSGAPIVPQPDTSDQPSEAMIAAFQYRLLAYRVGVSNVIEVSFSWSNAARAAEIANAVANAYISDQLNAKFEANRSATSWLQQRLNELSEQALTAERAVSAYKGQNNIVSSDGKPINEQQVTELNSRLVAARAQTSDASAKLSRYEAILSANSASPTSVGTLDAIGADTLTSPIINNLRQQYLELARRESEWSTRYGRDHLAVINLRTRMLDLRTSILDEVKRLAETSRSEFEVAKQRQQDIEKQLASAVSESRSANSAELTIRELETRAKGLRSLSETFLQRYMGAVQQETFPVSDTRVISPASAPESKSKPKTSLIMALGIVGGLAIGIALGLLRDLMDRVFRTSAQIEALLELPCVSLVPLLPTAKPRKPTGGSRQVDEHLRRRTISTESEVQRAVIDMPLSRFAEAIRSIKLAIDLNPTKTPNHVIGVTSALPNEGKTTIVACLSQLIGHSGKKVIVVDCDLRNPSLTASFAPNAAVGIIEVIDGTCSIEDTIWRDPKTNLVFLPAVRRRPLIHTSEILAGEGIRKLFEKLRTSYDYIIVDLPPLAPLVDVRTTSSLVDCFFLVVEWGRSKIDVVQHALHTAPNIYECVIGAVLNKTDMKAMVRYDTYRSDYYSDSHYAQYGSSNQIKPISTDLP